MPDLRQVLSILGMVALLFFGIPIRVGPPQEHAIREQLFVKYISDYNKSYRFNKTEYKQRFEAFQVCLQSLRK